ncbi:MAG: hypothetical protein MZV63_66005 [Marinilabiliales bacterium]|nr:hypothetical protein [Marinilabiliales bacterium]
MTRDGGPAVLHDQRRLRRLRGGASRARSRPASWPTSPCCRSDILTVPRGRDPRDRRSLYTIVGGKVLYHK